MLSITGYDSNKKDFDMVSEKDYYVHCCGHYKLITRQEFITTRSHGLNNYQLLYIAKGSAKFRIKHEMITVKAGECVLYYPEEEQYYSYHLKDQPDVYWIHFSFHDKYKFMKDTGFTNLNIYQIGTDSSYVFLFNQIIQELQLKSHSYQEIASLQLQELLLKMIRNYITCGIPGYKKLYNNQVENAIRIFHLKYDENFSIRDYSKEHKLNYSRFIDNFTKTTGVSPRQYIIQTRIQKAMELLNSTSLSIQDISEMIGYDNPLYFSRLFKKTLGMSPSEYRTKSSTS